MERYLRKSLGTTKFENVPEMRSRTMSAIRSRGNKTTELVLRMALVRAKVSGWEMHPSSIKGKPDFYFPVHRVAVFVDGCFWHGCPRCGHTPHTRSDYWATKFARNRARDRAASAFLRRNGVKVLRIWEHQLESPKSRARALEKIEVFLAEAVRPAAKCRNRPGAKR